MTPGARPVDMQWVAVGIPDPQGSLRGKAMTASQFDRAAERGSTAFTNLLLGLDPVDHPITTYTDLGFNLGAPDMEVRLELDTLRPMSWREGWGICLGTPLGPAGAPFEFNPREVLIRAVKAVAEQGLEPLTGVEYEVRLADAESGERPHAGLSYSLVDLPAYDRFTEALAPACDGLGIEISAIHTEAAPGLLELNLAPRDALTTADDAARLKTAVKEVAPLCGLRASFLAKTVPGEEGSSGHVHLSLSDGKQNVFAPDEGAPDGISAQMGAAIAGLLRHLPGLSLLYNPTINSYKRLVPGFFAPVNVSWGLENRSCAVRAVMNQGAEATRLELRRPGADANPYLAVAAVVASAGAGVAASLEPPKPYVAEASAASPEELAPLPASLEAALGAFRADGELPGLLGQEFCDWFAASRQWELAAWQDAVSDWERERYGPAV